MRADEAVLAANNLIGMASNTLLLLDAETETESKGEAQVEKRKCTKCRKEKDPSAFQSGGNHKTFVTKRCSECREALKATRARLLIKATSETENDPSKQICTNCWKTMDASNFLSAKEGSDATKAKTKTCADCRHRTGPGRKKRKLEAQLQNEPVRPAPVLTAPTPDLYEDWDKKRCARCGKLQDLGHFWCARSEGPTLDSFMECRMNNKRSRKNSQSTVSTSGSQNKAEGLPSGPGVNEVEDSALGERVLPGLSDEYDRSAREWHYRIEMLAAANPSAAMYYDTDAAGRLAGNES
ncbi:hypothetical protein BJY04DRAFT_215020 [Aspergillus karnatakaensis]|uniref:uncharacterized protein n=1 Tax=Aspergillus karnatakaensis TaxID=1810916 RepID=UPI003CCD30BC